MSYSEDAKEMLDADTEGFEAIEVLYESETFLTQLKELLSLNAQEFDLTADHALKLAKAANGLILESEDYLAKWLEITS